MISVGELAKQIRLARALESETVTIEVNALDALLQIAITTFITDWMCGPSDEDDLPREWEELRIALAEVDPSGGYHAMS